MQTRRYLAILFSTLLPLTACSSADPTSPDADESPSIAELGAELHTDLRGIPRCDEVGGCPVDLPVTRPVAYRFWGSSASDVWAVGKNSLTMNWNGTSWRRFGNPGTNDLWAVWGTASNDVWAVGDGPTILHWNGTAWSKAMGLPTIGGLNDVWGTSATDVWAVGNNGLVVRWDGTKWSQFTISYTNGFMTVWGAAANDMWIGGEAGLLLHWDGSKLNEVATSGIATIWRIRGSSTSNAYMTFDDGSKLSIWDGTKWTSTLDAYGLELWVVSTNKVWVVPSGGQFWFWNGLVWTRRDRRGSSVELAAFWATDNDGWLSDISGHFLHYNGTDWNPF